MRKPLKPLVLIAAVTASLALGACSEDVEVKGADAQVQHGAELFAERCSGCHTLTAAGTQGSGNRSLRVQGPNLDERKISKEDALYAIRNGGFAGPLMPQNIVVGDDAEAVAGFVAEYSGTKVQEAPGPNG